jgi:phage terminase Nu1 subunit (DNA packaging protein)
MKTLQNQKINNESSERDYSHVTETSFNFTKEEIELAEMSHSTFDDFEEGALADVVEEIRNRK